jgi:hypothetical protein
LTRDESVADRAGREKELIGHERAGDRIVAGAAGQSPKRTATATKSTRLSPA